jgi:hypothetical protein
VTFSVGGGGGIELCLPQREGGGVAFQGHRDTTLQGCVLWGEKGRGRRSTVSMNELANVKAKKVFLYTVGNINKYDLIFALRSVQYSPIPCAHRLKILLNCF